MVIFTRRSVKNDQVKRKGCPDKMKISAVLFVSVSRRRQGPSREIKTKTEKPELGCEGFKCVAI